MPYEGIGARHTAIASYACKHGDVVCFDKHVGTVFKIDQVDRFVRPADAQDIIIGEEVEVQVGGIHEVTLVAPRAAAAIGDRLWIAPATGVVDDASSAGALPVGVISDIDTSRNPDVARVNSNAWQAFLPGA